MNCEVCNVVMRLPLSRSFFCLSHQLESRDSVCSLSDLLPAGRLVLVSILPSPGSLVATPEFIYEQSLLSS